MMASNFTMRFQRNNGDLFITLNGDFDGSSARVLLDALKRNFLKNRHIAVDTNGLRDIHLFGCQVLQRDLSDLKKRATEIIFSGKNRHILEGM